MTWYGICYIIKTVKRGTNLTSTGQARKEKTMNEEMNANEMIKELAEENQTRKILELAQESKDKEEIIEKIKALLKK